jgi:hypothetical protein
MPHTVRGQPLISAYTKRRAGSAAGHSIPVEPVPLSITQAAGFDVLGPGRVRGRADDAAAGRVGKWRSAISLAYVH